MAIGSRQIRWAYFSVLLLLLSTLSVAQYNLSVFVRDDGRVIPKTLFGIFFEEINHAGSGGLWAELVANRGFEAGGQSTPSNIDPWSIIGNETYVRVETERSSLFVHNPIALKVQSFCNPCPSSGVGVYNPGFWGMNIVAGSQYNVVFWARSAADMNLSVAFMSSDGTKPLAQQYVFLGSSNDTQQWSKQELLLLATGTDHYGQLSFTTTQSGVFWLDQISAMPSDTYKGHGFRKDLALLLEGLKPRFIRFPGGCFVEGQWLRNSFQWHQTIGNWSERPGHFGDVWGYWTDDGLGYYEFLQLAEDLSAAPIWVFNNGVSHTDEVSSSVITPFVEDILDSLEFARGPSNSTWGAVRAAMGHPEPFSLDYVAIGNEDCGKRNYKGNYLKFYSAIKAMYPDMTIISNCDGSSKKLDHPADMYDFHVYTSASRLFAMTHRFDSISRTGPKAFVSEYAVTGKDAGKGSLLAALAEAAFLIGLEQNSDVVAMASYAPLFVNANDRRWNPDAIVFDAWQSYGTPSYWMQTLFRESSGSSLLLSGVKGQGASSDKLVASAIRRLDDISSLEYIDVKIVNVGDNNVTLHMTLEGIVSDELSLEAYVTRLTSQSAMDENSFNQTKKVFPNTQVVNNVGLTMDLNIPAFSLSLYSFQLTTPLYYNIM